MLAQRRRRWTNIQSPLVRCLLLSGLCGIACGSWPSSIRFCRFVSNEKNVIANCYNMLLYVLHKVLCFEHICCYLHHTLQIFIPNYDMHTILQFLVRIWFPASSCETANAPASTNNSRISAIYIRLHIILNVYTIICIAIHKFAACLKCS